MNRSIKTNFMAFMLLFTLISAVNPTQSPKTLPPVGTAEIVGKVDGMDIEVKVQGPSAQETPLQIICVFEYTEGDIYNSPPALPKDLNGLVHVDENLKGLFTELRKTNKFEGKALETLLIIPPPDTIPAKKLLLIGLGNRQGFKFDTMRMVGMIGMREALRLGVASYSHASDLKDAGLSSPTADVAGYIITGAIEAYRTQNYLLERHASSPLTVNKITLLAGPAYFEQSKEGVRRVISSLK